MTNELEKQFFDMFGIEKRVEFETCYALDSSNTYPVAVKRYPQISDRILLELICIYLDYRVLATQMSVKHLKQTVLQGLIELHEQYNHKIGYYEQVRTLFEEG